MVPDFRIEEELCTKCGLCTQECGHHSEGAGQLRVDLNNMDCSHCYHCYTVCPNHAIRFSDNRVGEQDAQRSGGNIQAVRQEDLLDFLAFRRSIRRFQEEPVDDAIVTKLIDGARCIPSGGNAHSYEFIVLKGDSSVKADLENELGRIYEKRSMLLNNVILRNAAKPFVDVLTRGFLRDKEYRVRIKALVERVHSNEDIFFRHAPIIIVIHSAAVIPTPKEDCILAGYNITMLAQAMGLGSCFVTLAQNAINSSRQCKRLLGLSDNDSIYAVLILGYPAVKHLRNAPKKEKEIRWL